MHRIFTTAFADVYPAYVAKVERKGRTEAELREVITWLTGYDDTAIDRAIADRVTFETFFSGATLNLSLTDAPVSGVTSLPNPSTVTIYSAPAITLVFKGDGGAVTAGTCCTSVQTVLVEQHQLPLPDNSVDKLLAIHCLEMSEAVGPLLREIWRVLAPQGRLVMASRGRSS